LNDSTLSHDAGFERARIQPRRNSPGKSWALAPEGMRSAARKAVTSSICSVIFG
jgi:hypothetical protein